MIRLVPLQEAVGLRLAHDVTEIRPGEFKGPAFRRGDLISPDNVCHLQRLGKNQIYVLEPGPEEIHEDEAAVILAAALAGEGVVWEGSPREGKIGLLAGRDGLLRVDAAALLAFNLRPEVMCASRHDHSLVKEGDLVAATRAIPLLMPRQAIEEAAAEARRAGGVISVRPLKRARAGLIVTGQEVFDGLIQDRFAPIVSRKLSDLGSELVRTDLAPDDETVIASLIAAHLSQGLDLIVLTGGMSVDPDDVTRLGVALSGAEEINYGSAVLPGAMFLTAYVRGVPLVGLPACGIYHQTTAFDLVLPRLLAGERIGRLELARLGHGGLCLNCPTCRFPDCAFGKGA